MVTTPSWEAAKSGLPGHLDSTNHATQIDQFLGTHTVTPVYEGVQLVTPAGYEYALLSNSSSNSYDLDQPFTLPSGTTIGRITVPVSIGGQGADIQVSLYPDNGSGFPNTSNLLASTKIPASWMRNLAAPSGFPSAGPLATPRFNAALTTSAFTSQQWAGPAGDSTGIAQNPTAVTSGNYLVILGGYTSAPVSAVTVIQYEGGTAISNGVSAPPLPQGTVRGSCAATSGSLVFAGGSNGSVISTVWTANWDNNTGTVGTWSSQASLPQAVMGAASAASGNTVYIIGGSTASAAVSSVYYTTVSNGQISSWNTGPSLPKALYSPIVGVVGGWLIVAGGSTAPFPGTTASGSVYYAAIDSDGSLGAWQTGPSLPTPVFAYAPGWDCVVTDSALVVVCGWESFTALTTSISIQTLSASPSGIAPEWAVSQWWEFGVELMAGFPIGNGNWMMVNPNIPTSTSHCMAIGPVPLLSVPLSATGLTAGATYHVLLQQDQAADAADYTYFVEQYQALPASMLRSPRHANTWTTLSPGWAIPISVFDGSSGGPILHTWEDPSSTGSAANSNIAARTTTFVWGQQSQLLGLCESTLLPNDPLNSNPTFTSGTSPWAAHNCTLTQSTAQTHGGFAFSGLMTPAGGSATCNVTSELVPIRAVYPQFSNAQWYQVNGWFYSPTGWATFLLNVDWYDATSTYISTSSATTALAAATWTNVVQTYQPPTTAAFASISVTEGGTPGTSNTIYLSNVTIALSPELTKTVAPVSEITYSGQWPPTGVTQLA